MKILSDFCMLLVSAFGRDMVIEYPSAKQASASGATYHQRNRSLLRRLGLKADGTATSGACFGLAFSFFAVCAILTSCEPNQPPLRPGATNRAGCGSSRHT